MSLSRAAPRVGRRAFLTVGALAATASAMARTPLGGTLRLSIPWPLDALDPHAIDDPTAALFGVAVTEPLFALDPRGNPYPTLAARQPQQTARGTRLELRPHLKTGRGRSLDARDLLFTWQRARVRAAAGLLGPLGEPFLDPEDDLALIVPGAAPEQLAVALASPATALVPRSFDRLRPDGTGAFKATTGRDRLRLERNPSAARGASFLDAVEVTHAHDLAESLRAFEAGEADVGWLGRGLHRPRPGATDFSGPRLGWAILRTGRLAGAWGAPGVAQRLLDGVAPARLEHLGLYGFPVRQGQTHWGGGPATIVVREDAPHLDKIASAVASILSQPGHELRVERRHPDAVTRLRRDGEFSLLVDFARRIGPSSQHASLSLLTAADPNLARRPPRQLADDPRATARTLALGVIGEFGIRGAHLGLPRGIPSWDFGNMHLPL